MEEQATVTDNHTENEAEIIQTLKYNPHDAEVREAAFILPYKAFTDAECRKAYRTMRRLEDEGANWKESDFPNFSNSSGLPVVPSVMNLKETVRRVAKWHEKNQAVQLASEMAKAGGDPKKMAKVRSSLDGLWTYEPSETSWLSQVKTESVGELMGREIEKPRFLIDDYKAQAGLMIFSGFPKVGKSIKELQEAVAISQGGMMFGKNAEQQDVLLIALEDGDWTIQDRLSKMGVDQINNLALQIMYADEFMKAFGYLRDDKSVQRLIKFIEYGNFGVTYIDTFTNATMISDQKERRDVDRLMIPLQQFCIADKRIIEFTDHFSKGFRASGNPVLDTYGSIGKSANVDSTMGIYSTQGTKKRKLKGVSRHHPETELEILLNTETLTWELAGKDDPGPASALQEELMEILGVGGEFRLMELSEITEKHKSSVFRSLKGLMQKGSVTKIGSAYQLSAQGKDKKPIPF